ncbi:MAG: glycine hydroxymethyltransferase, partial [Verrucomicrobiota bacterium]
MSAPRRHVLFVCTGNICRSPMAEGLFRKLTAGLKGITTESAGLSAASGAPPSTDAVRVLAEKEVDISKLRSQPVTEKLLD